MEAYRRTEMVLAQVPGSQAMPKDEHLQQDLNC